MKILYNIGIYIYTALIHFASVFNSKARLLVAGRKGWEEKLKSKINPGDKYIWVHCASLGEFEQGRPIIERVKKEHPDKKILVTFFSPSGYEVRKNFSQADIVCYLPADTPENARRFVKLVNPLLVIFVKYEFWYNFINQVHKNGSHLMLISGIFRPQQHFFSWYGGFFRNMLKKFDFIYVQDKESGKLLQSININNYSVAGDTRFDRVMQIAKAAKDIPQLASFKNDEKLLLCGSSWTPDEAIIAEYINKYPDKLKWLFAPHEIHESNIDRLEGLFKTKVVRFSRYNDNQQDARVLIIDNIGMLSSAYRYATIAAIGGGFGKGIHNILEAACWGLPVVFGPNHLKFKEAIDMIRIGGAKSFTNYEEFSSIIDKWLTDDEEYKKAATAAGKYVHDNAGATDIIMKAINSIK